MLLLGLVPGLGGAAEPAFEVTTNSYQFGQAPDWMPDGEHVVHHAFDEDGTNQIYIAALDGSDPRCLTCGQPGPNMVPDSRPQGDVILFHSWRGTNITLGAPGFGGLGSDLYVVPVDGGDAIALTNDHDGYDNYHAYFSPDGNRIVWTRLNWNFVTDTGRGYWDIRVADYVVDETGAASREHHGRPRRARPLLRDPALVAGRLRLPVHREHRHHGESGVVLPRPLQAGRGSRRACGGSPTIPRGTSRRSSRPT